MEAEKLDSELFKRVRDALADHLAECRPCEVAFANGDNVMMCAEGQDVFDDWYTF